MYRHAWSSWLHTQLKQLWNLSLKKIRLERDSNPWPLRYQCCAPPTGLSSQLGIITRPAPSWLDSSVGRALHRYRRGQGFESRLSLKFFRLKFHSCLSSVHNYDDQWCLYRVDNSLNSHSLPLFPYWCKEIHKEWKIRLCNFRREVIRS